MTIGYARISLLSMSRRITVTVPDDIAAQLDEQINVSAYVASAVAARLTRDRAHAHQADHGFRVHPRGQSLGQTRARRRRCRP